MNLPEAFRRTIIQTFDQGDVWLEELPPRIEAISERWSLEVGPPVENLSYNYVAPAIRSDGSEAILKLGPPNPELSTEIEVLKLYDGDGCAFLMESDADVGALLLERLRPGIMLSSLEDDSEATSILAGVMRSLWQPLPAENPFPSLNRWFRALIEHRGRFGGASGPVPTRLFDEAESLFAELIESQGAPVLLHGDIHHFNVLSAERAPWLAIDPKGLFGEREFDTAQMLLNPWPQLLEMPDPRRILTRRIDQLADELGFDRTRIRGWGLANAVLSACWAVEDGTFAEPQYDLACAEILSSIPA